MDYYRSPLVGSKPIKEKKALAIMRYTRAVRI
jgi:hypothetical protein